MRIAVAADGSLRAELLKRLGRHHEIVIGLPASGTDAVVYAPVLGAARRADPRLAEAEAFLASVARATAPPVHIVVISSAAVYGADHHNPGLMIESRPPRRAGVKSAVAAGWQQLEEIAAARVGEIHGCVLTVLRPSAVLDGASHFSRLLSRRVAAAVPGHDPVIQLLSPGDLADAVERALLERRGGVYNVAPSGAIPLRVALRLAGTVRVPVPRTLQRAIRSIAAPLGLMDSADQIEYLRYPWTVSAAKIARELGFHAGRSSAEALSEYLVHDGRRAVTEPAGEFDPFGMDPDYIAAYGRTLLAFLRRRYWRIEVRGLGHVPRTGAAVLVGMHRGFMPWDGVMTLDTVVKGTGRAPRFLVHPTLVKFPFLFNFMTKLGGIIACQQNADFVLERGGLLGFYPEGIHGAFTPYRRAYRLGKFGRNEFVRAALRHGAPIVPFVTVGSAEIFPILGRIDWSWWKRYSEWPYLPLTPTFPLVPLPLPTKWHMWFLAPLHVERQYAPNAAEDPAVLRQVSEEVRRRMQAAIDWMLRRRRSVFFGSVFDAHEATEAVEHDRQV